MYIIVQRWIRGRGHRGPWRLPRLIHEPFIKKQYSKKGIVIKKCPLPTKIRPEAAIG